MQSAQDACIDECQTSELSFAGTSINGHARFDLLALSQEAAQSLPAAIYTTDAEGRITFYNEAAAAFWGCRPELGKSEFCGSWKLYRKDGTPLPHDQCPMAVALKQRRPVRGMEAVAERPDGTRIPFIPYPTPLFDASGTLTGAVNMLVDISELKQAERVLADRNTQLALAAQIALVGSFTHDIGSGTMQVSPGYAAIHGLPEGTVETKRADWRARVYPEDLLTLDADLEQAIAGERCSHRCEYRIVRADGEIRWIESRSQISYDADGAARRIVGANIDVTERKNTELELAERTMHCSLAGKAALVGSFAFDVGSERMRISAGYAAIHGFSEGTAEIARSEWQSGVHPEDRVRLEELRSRCYRERLHEYAADYRIVRPPGDLRWIDARCFVSYHADGRPKRVVGVNIDVTERKRAEEHHRALNAELDHRVKNVLATVIAIISQTQEASGSLAGFVAGLDHRIKSMARTHELLSESNWRWVPLAEIVRRELAPYAAGNAEFSGPDVTLKAQATQAVAMVIHELTTNAAKHGAFSVRSGRLLLRWWLQQDGSRSALAIEWREIGCPSAPAPGKSGYGTSIIRELIPYELGGRANLAFAPDGLRCRLDIPADWISRCGRLNAG
jgi:PAS domain S-box-containing protein